MKAIRSRKGSALLIVLGMLSFIVVSAIAFAAYMRASRLPSSYLRRTAAARLLAKAAMSEAIEEIDAAIGDNPYPDQRVGERVPSQNRMANLGKTGGDCRNYWWHNVFIGDKTWLDPSETVSTLTLEGLAYIPPPLVNEARRYSRMSHAATWHNLGFDSGRYAFCAIDVTDCLDINQLVANGRRNSGRRRITLAHLFENSEHTSYESQPSSWESFMEKFRVKLADDQEDSSPRFVSSKVPLVSVADWNLAVHADSSAGMTSPFCDYIENYDGSFYGLTSAEGSKAEKIRQMRFVTDSYLPPRALESNEEVNLASAEGQPFDTFSDSATLTEVLKLREKESKVIENLKVISGLDFVNLYDYLDENNVPVSLAVPTTERVPMVCAVTPTINGATFALEGGAPSKKDSEPSGNTIRRRLEYKLDAGKLLPGGIIDALVAFPFLRGKERNEEFTYDACIRIFFAPKNIDLRPANQAAIKPVKNEDFTNTNPVLANNVITIGIPKPFDEPKFKGKNIAKETDAVDSLKFRVNKLSQDVFSEPVFWIEGTCQVKNGVTDDSSFTPDKAKMNILPLGKDSKEEQLYQKGEKALAEFLWNGGNEVDYALHVAVYIRVKNSDGKTVDLVPAFCTNDKDLNNIDNSKFGTKLGSNPILHFNSSQTLRFSREAFENMAGDTIAFEPEGLMCPDPRFNYAPENWIKKSVTDAQSWLENCGADKRDGDIFMFVSDQKYLQSVYELAFLPNLSELNNGYIFGNCSLPTASVSEYPEQIEDCLNGNLMWNTYRCYDNKNGARHDFEDIGLVLNDSAYRINPYVQSPDALMAAFANTPYDWWAASTNNQDISVSDCDDAKAFNSKYAFSKMNNNAKFAWDDLKEIAKNFRDKVRQSNGNWEDAFDSLDWNGTEDTFCGVNLSGDTDDLYCVDRKFLYGFWHDAFANRQQLFLVFVRAEPMMMGGGAVGQTPPSLGARAVALVWRDPEAPEPTAGASLDTPHRTRILFYRQFD